MAKIARFCLTGPESTGKTTLAMRLAAHFGTVWVPEFSRRYAEVKPGPLAYEDVEPIAEGQITLEEQVLGQWKGGSTGLLILDTDLVSSVVYSSYCYGQVPSSVNAAAQGRLADLYMLLDVDVPYIEDPVRSSIEHRAALFTRFRDTLERFGARYETVGGDWEQRSARATELIERFVGAPCREG